MRCVYCLAEGIDTETDLVVDGYSICIKHIKERTDMYKKKNEEYEWIMVDE